MVSEGWTENLKSENGGTEAAENGEIKLFKNMIARLFELWCNAPVNKFSVMFQWSCWEIASIMGSKIHLAELGNSAAVGFETKSGHLGSESNSQPLYHQVLKFNYQ